MRAKKQSKKSVIFDFLVCKRKLKIKTFFVKLYYKSLHYIFLFSAKCWTNKGKIVIYPLERYENG